jgi:hypothetical protein
MREHDRVVLTADLPDHGLQACDVGSIVHTYTAELAYEVDFGAVDGRTIAVPSVPAEKPRDVGYDELTRARPMGADWTRAVGEAAAVRKKRATVYTQA